MYARCLIVACGLVMFVGCASTNPKQTPASTSPKRAEALAPPYTWAHNPTTLQGRGQPSLSDQRKPAAWIFVDDQPGAYRTVDGTPQLEWRIDSPVSSTPTVRIEVFQPLVGTPDRIRLVLTPLAKDTGAMGYLITAEPGAMVAGQTYALANLGEGFTVRDMTHSPSPLLDGIPPLEPGTYILAASLHNSEKDVDTPAVTCFVVREATGQN